MSIDAPQVRQGLALRIGTSPAEEPAVPLHGDERRRLIPVLWLHSPHVMVAVDQHGGSIRCFMPLRKDSRPSVARPQLHPRKTGLAECCRKPVGRPRDILSMLGNTGNRGDADPL